MAKKSRALSLHRAQAAAEGATRERLERIGGHGALIINWLDAAPPIVAFLRERREDHKALLLWRERNRHALREFWARASASSRSSKKRWCRTKSRRHTAPARKAR